MLTIRKTSQDCVKTSTAVGQFAKQGCDLAVPALADSVVAQFGGLDVVVACAGLMPLSPLNALKLEEWERMIDVNIRGLLFSIAAVLPPFQRHGGGHFVTIGSTAAGEVIPASAVRVLPE